MPDMLALQCVHATALTHHTMQWPTHAKVGRNAIASRVRVQAISCLSVCGSSKNMAVTSPEVVCFTHTCRWGWPAGWHLLQGGEAMSMLQDSTTPKKMCYKHCELLPTSE